MSPRSPPRTSRSIAELADISESFRFLLDLTPVNVGRRTRRVPRSADEEPAFEYRDLEDDPAVLRAELDAVDVDGVVDHTLAHLVHAKRRELELQIEMLASRGHREFRSLSIELYGTVPAGLLEQARVDPSIRCTPSPAADSGRALDADQFARLRRARARSLPRRRSRPLVARRDPRRHAASVMVADGDLLIPSGLRISAARATALLQHEIGTHVVTYVNGCHQPIRLLGRRPRRTRGDARGAGAVRRVAQRRARSRRGCASSRREWWPCTGWSTGKTFREVHNELVDAGVHTGARRSASRCACSVPVGSPRISSTCAG